MPLGPSHTSPWSLPVKLRHQHTGLPRSRKPWNSHRRKASGHRSFLQLARKVVSSHSCSHSQSRQRLPLLHTQIEKDSKQRILRQLPSGSRAIGSCFSSGHQTQEGLYFSADFLYIWLLTGEMLQIHPIYGQQCWLSKGNHLVDSWQERPKRHRIHEGSVPFPPECIGPRHSPEALAFAASATKESCLFHFCFWLLD